jgi:hypothetical protein
MTGSWSATVLLVILFPQRFCEKPNFTHSRLNNPDFLKRWWVPRGLLGYRSETTLTEEILVSHKYPQGILTWDPHDGKQTGSPLDQ